jgi:hypothetical protein
LQGRKSKVDPYVLLRLIVDDYLDGAARSDDFVGSLERLYGLPDLKN